MKRLTFLIAVLASLFIVSGCGQSGPLYVPGNPSTMAVPPSQDTASEEEEEKEEEKDSGESSETNE
jgi:predicted small lipoprotein YifL